MKQITAIGILTFIMLFLGENKNNFRYDCRTNYNEIVYDDNLDFLSKKLDIIIVI